MFDAEPNDAPAEPQRSLNTTGAALGYLGDETGEGSGQGGGLPAGDLYTIDVAAGEVLAVRTATPMDHAASTPGNSLDPQLAVFSPSGQPLAMDTGSLDGKNAQITWRADETGTYTIEVGAESGRGEYLLDARLLPLGDLNGDGVFDLDDVNPFVMGLVDPSTYRDTFGFSASVLGDMDSDGDLDVDDVGAFLDQLLGQPPPGGGAQTFRSGPFRGGGGPAGRHDWHAESVDAVYSEDGQQDWLDDDAWPWIRPRRR